MRRFFERRPTPVSVGDQARVPAGQIRERRSRWALREFLLIVAGVLTALGAQAFWESRQERNREDTYLRQLLVDLTETERGLAAEIDAEQNAGAATAVMLRAVQAGPPHVDSLRAWLEQTHWAFYYSDPRQVMGTITALQETGDLKIIHDEALRVALSSYAHYMAAEWSEFSRWVDEDIRQYQRFNELGARAVESYPIGVSREDSRTRARLFAAALWEDPELRVVLTNVQWARATRNFYLARMREATASLSRLVRETQRARSASASD